MTTLVHSATVSRRNQSLQALTAPVVSFLTDSTWVRRRDDPGAMDFVVGNPHEMPLPGYVDALRQQLEPRSTDWFAYQMSDPTACATVARGLQARLSAAFQPYDILMTTGAFAGLSVAMKTLVDPGDEVIYVSPPWFFYASLISAEGGVPVPVYARPPDFRLDVSAIAEALTPSTRAVIVNSPHNPTGRVYSPTELHALAELLDAVSAAYGRRIYLVSDEAYSRILFDGREFFSPTSFYPWSILVYTYSKTLLTPGQRIGYLALPPTIPLADRQALRDGLTLAQVTTGYAFPNALLQHALPDLEKLTIDVAALQRRRDVLVTELRHFGYSVTNPEGTFYVLPQSPDGDDVAFAERLAAENVFVLPGSVVDLPGYFRMSLTATDDMLERALPVLARFAVVGRDRS